MRALTIENGRLSLAHDASADQVGECRIRVRLAGICGTDLQLLQGYAGFSGIPGHEFVGIVDDAPDPRWIGRRVVGEINVGCGSCSWCAADMKEHCPRRSVLGIKGRSGAFAEHVWLPPRNLHEIPDAVSDEEAVFVEPLAAGCRILDQVPVMSGMRVAVVGDGRMGLLVAQVLRTTGAAVLLIGKHQWKLDVASRLGIDTRLLSEHASGDDVSGDRSSRTELFDPFDLVVDVTGSPTGLTRSLDLVRPRGTIVMKSTFHGEVPVTLWPTIVNEVSLVGSRCGPFEPAIDFLARRAVDVKPLVSRVCALEEFETAFAAARRELKVLFRL